MNQPITQATGILKLARERFLREGRTAAIINLQVIDRAERLAAAA